MAEQRGVDAVERAFQVLDCFDGSVANLSLADLSRRTGLYKSTILRLSVSLERFGYVVRREDGRFRLGPTTWRLGAAYRRSFDVAEIVRPELKALSDATNETASFYVRDGDSRVCLYRSEPPRAIRHSIAEGARMPLDRGASGRVLLAHSSGEPPRADTARIKEAGYAVSLGERDPEVASIAMPVFDNEGWLRGAVAVSGLITRFQDERQPPLIAALRQSQARLTAQIAAR